MLGTLQRCAQLAHLCRGGLLVDRLWRSIAQTIKDNSSAFIKASISSYLR